MLALTCQFVGPDAGATWRVRGELVLGRGGAERGFEGRPALSGHVRIVLIVNPACSPVASVRSGCTDGDSAARIAVLRWKTTLPLSNCVPAPLTTVCRRRDVEGPSHTRRENSVHWGRWYIFGDGPCGVHHRRPDLRRGRRVQKIKAANP